MFRNLVQLSVYERIDRILEASVWSRIVVGHARRQIRGLRIGRIVVCVVRGRFGGLELSKHWKEVSGLISIAILEHTAFELVHSPWCDFSGLQTTSWQLIGTAADCTLVVALIDPCPLLFSAQCGSSGACQPSSCCKDFLVFLLCSDA